jgi:GAF domain-containing protein/HAMP domain-containing protein
MMSMQEEKTKTSRSLTATLAIAFLALSVAVLLVASSIEMVFNFQTQQETIAGKQQLIAQEAANTVSSFIQEKYSVLGTAVKLGDPSSASQEEQKRALEYLLGLDRAFRQLILLDVQDQELVKVSRISQAAAEQLMGRLESDLFTQVRQGNRYISSVYIDELTSEPLVTMAVPATDNFGDFQGTLLAEVNLKFMWDLVDRLEIGQTGQAYVVDRRGNLIAFKDSARVLKGENLSHLKKVGEYINSTASVDETGAGLSEGIDGTSIVGTYVPLGTPDWAVVTELPVSEAYKGVIRGAVISVGVILVMAVLAGLIGVYVARRLAVPLLNLTETVTQITEGELDLEATVEGPTEVTHLAGAFNSMTAQLRELIGTLEQRVVGRTQRLEMLATLSERLTAILDFEQLLTELVNQVKERFDYYHAHVYILDESRQDLVMAAGAGQAGAEMKAQGHHIPLNASTSLVARAARSSEIVWVDDVREAEDWLPNPLLPDTYAEMAVPIILEGQMVGVLDVQEDEIAGLDEGDANLLRSLANQVAVAIRNAHLFAEVEAALARARVAQEQYIEQAWEKVKTVQQGAVYQCHRSGTPLLDETVIAQLEQEAMTKNQVAVVAVNGGDIERKWAESDTSDAEIDYIQDSKSEIQKQTALVAPIRLQNQTIGTIQLLETQGPHQWDELELALVQAVADQVAQAAENLRLFEETRQRAGREQTIRQITEHIRSATNLDELVKIAAEELGQRFSAEYSLVELGIESNEEHHAE